MTKSLAALVMVACVGACTVEEAPPMEVDEIGGGGADSGSAASGEAVAAASSGAGGTGAGSSTAPACGEPVQEDLSIFEPCPMSVCGGGAHCVEDDLVAIASAQAGADMTQFLGRCGYGSWCVPDEFLIYMNNLELETCESFMGYEGRCLSECLPLVGDNAELLPQSSCRQDYRCLPCYDPVSNEPTGLCGFSACDQPREPKPEPQPKCCGTRATCFPDEMIPDEMEQVLVQEACPESGQLCVPDEFLQMGGVEGTDGFDPEVCEPGTLLQLMGIDDGVCVSDCLAIPFVDQGSCPAGSQCAPCDVMGEPTGICVDPW